MKQRIGIIGGSGLYEIEELIWQDDVAGLVVRLERSHGTDADNPRDAEFFHRPDVGAMIQFARENAVPARVPRQENHFAARQLTRQQ